MHLQEGNEAEETGEESEARLGDGAGGTTGGRDNGPAGGGSGPRAGASASGTSDGRGGGAPRARAAGWVGSSAGGRCASGGPGGGFPASGHDVSAGSVGAWGGEGDDGGDGGGTSAVALVPCPVGLVVTAVASLVDALGDGIVTAELGLRGHIVLSEALSPARWGAGGGDDGRGAGAGSGVCGRAGSVAGGGGGGRAVALVPRPVGLVLGGGALLLDAGIDGGVAAELGLRGDLVLGEAFSPARWVGRAAWDRGGGDGGGGAAAVDNGGAADWGAAVGRWCDRGADGADWAAARSVCGRSALGSGQDGGRQGGDGNSLGVHFGLLLWSIKYQIKKEERVLNEESVD